MTVDYKKCTECGGSGEAIGGYCLCCCGSGKILIIKEDAVRVVCNYELCGNCGGLSTTIPLFCDQYSLLLKDHEGKPMSGEECLIDNDM